MLCDTSPPPPLRAGFASPPLAGDRGAPSQLSVGRRTLPQPSGSQTAASSTEEASFQAPSAATISGDAEPRCAMDSGLPASVTPWGPVLTRQRSKSAWSPPHLTVWRQPQQPRCSRCGKEAAGTCHWGWGHACRAPHLAPWGCWWQAGLGGPESTSRLGMVSACGARNHRMCASGEASHARWEAGLSAPSGPRGILRGQLGREPTALLHPGGKGAASLRRARTPHSHM